MFSNVVAWAVFAATSLLLIAAAYETFRTKSEADKALERLQHYSGKRTKISAVRVLIVFAVWFAAGVYVLG